MPLSQPQDRELLHSRDIVLRGYRRSDGLYDIEAQLTDAKKATVRPTTTAAISRPGTRSTACGCA